MIREIFGVIVLRFSELFFVNTAISMVLVVLNKVNILQSRGALLLGTLVGIAVFAVINFRMLRQCYFDLKGGLAYYIANTAAYLLYVLLGIAVYIVFSNRVYTLFFALTKFLRYTALDISLLCSAAVFHVIGLALIFSAPIGMGWIFEQTEDE